MKMECKKFLINETIRYVVREMYEIVPQLKNTLRKNIGSSTHIVMKVVN